MDDIDHEIQKEREKRKELQEKVEFGRLGQFDQDIYGGSGMDRSAYVDELGEETEDPEFFMKESQMQATKKLPSYTAPKELLEDKNLFKQDEDPFADNKKKYISERESDYHKRWRKRVLSPERADSFAVAQGKAAPSNARTYKEVLEQHMLEREKAALMAKARQKEREEAEAKQQEKENPQANKKPMTPPLPSSSRGGSSRESPSRSSSGKRGRSDKEGGGGGDRDWDRGKERGGKSSREDEERRGSSSSRQRKEKSEWSDEEDGGDRRKDKKPKHEWGTAEMRQKMEDDKAKKNMESKAKPNFELSGKLAAATNTVNGVTLKWSEPPDLCQPAKKWLLYILKSGEPLGEPLKMYRSKAFMFGRETKPNVVDIRTDHPSCSKQHAVLCFRLVKERDDEGTIKQIVKPYIIDLQSTNGTFVNGERIPDSSYYELREKDVVKFGNSSREYVLLHTESHAE